MEMLGHVLPDDALDPHKCYIINGDELYLLMEVEAVFARMGKHEISMHLHNLVRSALDNELEEEV